MSAPRTGAVRVRVLAIGGFVLGLAFVTAAAVLLVMGSSSTHEAQARQQTEVSAAAQQAATAYSRQVDVVRLAALLAGRDPRLTAVVQHGTRASAAERAAARQALEDVVTLRVGLASVARLRSASGVELVRAVDRPESGPVATKPIVTSGLVAALADPGSVSTSMPHLSGVLGVDVVSTAVAVGPSPALGAIEIETPVAWLTQMAAQSVGIDHELRFVSPSEAEHRLGAGPRQPFGVTPGADETTGWARTAFDDQVRGAIGLDSVVTVQEPTAHGADTRTPLAVLLGVLGLALLLVALGAVLVMLRRTRRARRAALEANRRLQERLADMSTALGQVAAGDLAAALPVQEFEDGALRSMASSFESTLGRLRDLVSQAQRNGTSLAQASVELRAAAAQQAGAATEQSSVVTETTATIEELAATAAQIAQTAEQVAQAAAETLRLTEEGRAAVGASVDAMAALTARVSAIGTRAVGLGETGRQISQILGVIDDLSERTNLLALNAAIEAARAGEQGQGFAVVAAEVRRLAERARASTTQIQALVTRIATESSAAEAAAQEGRHEVERARGVAYEVAGALERIAGMVDETTMATREISIATQQQRSASDQVVVAMGQVSDTSRQYAVGSRQAAASAQELAMLAEAMEATIRTFSTDAVPDADEGSREEAVVPV